jgi:DNA-binding HxlR family transcriptional regulator
MPAFMCRGQLYYNPVQLALDTLGGKWKMPILWRLKDRVLRYAELRESLNKNMPDAQVTDRALALQLRELMQYGLIERHEKEGRAKHVEYRITAYGKEAIPVIELLQRYGHAVLAFEQQRSTKNK